MRHESSRERRSHPAERRRPRQSTAGVCVSVCCSVGEMDERETEIIPAGVVINWVPPEIGSPLRPHAHIAFTLFNDSLYNDHLSPY